MKLSLEQMACIESEILRQVRARPGVSRVELARRLQIAPSTAGSYVGRLITEGFLEESEKAGAPETGRPPTALWLNPAGGRFIGVDFEARNIMAMAVDFSDKPLKRAHRSIQESDSASRIIGKIEQAIVEVLPDDASRLLAIGVGVPGLVDPSRGVAVHYKYIRRWQNIPLAAPLAAQFGVPVYLENNVRSMALAEMWFGQGRGLENFLCLGIRSGIGAGIVAGGQLQHGARHRAGEIGRWRCPWPSRATARLFAGDDAAEDTELQEVASVRAMVSALERARRGHGKNAGRQPLEFADVVRAGQQRDPLVVPIIEAAAAMLGGAVAQLVLALNSSHVILAGPLTLLGDTLLRPLRARAAEILQASDANVPAIVHSSMGEYSGALGAAALAVQEWRPAR
ncbi:MAG: ROK family transcriptional regulator [Verrucomicrobiota bacterium]|nr:ROK family transcriptional regulator [Verrucomicrobiota bacterium]